MKVGIAVYCTKCHLQKKPIGRSAPMMINFCNYDCSEYEAEPKPGDLWPNESEEEFGHPVRQAATKEVDR